MTYNELRWQWCLWYCVGGGGWGGAGRGGGAASAVVVAILKVQGQP